MKRVCLSLAFIGFLFFMVMSTLSFAESVDVSRKFNQFRNERDNAESQIEDSFDSLFGESGSLYWLTTGTPPDSMNSIEGPFSSSSGDLGSSDFVYSIENNYEGVVIDNADDSFTNAGFIYTFPDYSSSDEAYGIENDSTASDISIWNSGSIYVGIDSPDDYCYLYGISADPSTTAFVENDGNIFLEVESPGMIDEGEDLYGLYIDTDNSKVTNKGNIFLHGSNQSDGSHYADVYSYGIHVDSDSTEINNSGDILVYGESTTGDYTYVESYGIYVDTDDATISNSGNIFVKSFLSDTTGNFGDNITLAFGIYADLNNDGKVINTGLIDVYSYAEDTEHDRLGSAGIFLEHADTCSITNAGKIFSRADILNTDNTNEFGNYGICSYENDSTNIINTGDILVDTSLTNLGNYIPGSISYASGIYAESSSETKIYNSGNILVNLSSTEAPQSDIYGYGIYVRSSGSSTVTNTGLIAVTGDFPEGAAIGFNNVTSGTLQSGGTIYTSTNVYGLSVRNSSNVTLLNSFGYAFHGDPDVHLEPIFVDNTSSLDLNNSTLIAYTGDDLYFNEPYPLFDDAGTGAVNGSFSTLRKGFSNPDIEVEWADAERGANSAVVFTYDPKESMGATAIHAAYTTVRSSMDRVFDFAFRRSIQQDTTLAKINKPIMLADARSVTTGLGGFTTSQYSNGVFVLPYYANTDADDLGYDADSWGMQIGYEKKFSRDLRLGAFGGFGRSDVDFTDDGYDENNDDQDTYSAGIYGLYNYGSWYTALLVSYNRVVHHYDGQTGPNLSIDEDDRYSSWAIESKVLGGYAFDFGNVSLVPVVGLEYTPWHTESHTTDADNPSWNKHYGEENCDFVRALGGVDVLGSWSTQQGFEVGLTAGVRVEQALNDNDIEVTQSLPGIQPVTLEEDVDDTSVLGHASISVSFEQFDFNLSFSGEYNDDYAVYGGFLSAGFRF